MEKSELKELLVRYSAGECTEEEAIWVENWYARQDSDGGLPVSDEEFQRHLAAIYRRLPQVPRSKASSTWMKIAAAVSFFVLSIGAYNYLNRGDHDLKTEVYSIAKDIAPGGNKATLTLSDGTVVELDQIREGEIYKNRNANIRKTKDGEIEYIPSSEPFPSNASPKYNQINTPTGGQYQVTLPDGSKVWLNSSSTLKYPTHFSASERAVELTGEAYFEVAKATAPFFVNTANQRIEVLGTHFNVNAYADEAGTKTTLVEGSVKLIAVKAEKEMNRNIILKPGEEALLIRDQGIQVYKINVKQGIAWKNGFFHFEGDDLKSVMREFSRWYGVEVAFEGVIPETKLWGEISRNVPASQALNILKYYDLDFKVVQNKGLSKIEISNNN